jgi:hypothetical protein
MSQDMNGGSASNLPDEREREGVPGITFDDLMSLARDARSKYGSLAPYGGYRWTAEDTAAAVSILVEVTERFAFREACRRGMTREAMLHYLDRALRNSLVNARKRAHQLELLDGHALDGLSRSCSCEEALAQPDRAVLASRVLTALTPDERFALEEMVDAADRTAVPRSWSKRTRKRRRAQVTEVLKVVIVGAELSSEELLALLRHLTDTLAGSKAVPPESQESLAPEGGLDC